MLVLKRKEGEAIVIGKDVKVVILEIESSSVKVGIEAPKSITIFREEVLKKIEERMRASVVSEVEGTKEGSE